jgi:hypothetical protein
MPTKPYLREHDKTSTIGAFQIFNLSVVIVLIPYKKINLNLNITNKALW